MNNKQNRASLQACPQAWRAEAGLDWIGAGAAGGAFEDPFAPIDAEFMRWADLASQGSAEAARLMLGRPVQMRMLLGRMAEAADGAPAPMSLGSAPAPRPGQGQGRGRPAPGFLEGGLPSRPEDLAARYAALESKDGRLDFKSDMQAMERAILGGSADALRELAERSPMALWAMDFSLSEYEDENILAFCAKHAPAGADIEIIALLRSLGARAPLLRVELEVGWAAGGAPGSKVKSVAERAAALLAAGYEFGPADGLMLMRGGRGEGMEAPEGGSALLQKLGWLDWIQERGFADWSAPMDEGQARSALALLPEPRQGGGGRCGECEADFLDFIQACGPAGLGAWAGLAKAPLRGEESWARLGPWLGERGLAVEAHLAAARSGAAQSLPLILPWAQAQALRESCPEAAISAARPRERALRI